MKTWFVADFETTSYKHYALTGETHVWLWCVVDSDCEVIDYGTDIKSFMAFCRDNPNSTIYFHNLKFDGSFILNHLINEGYEYCEKISSVSNRGYSTLIGEEGQFYSIDVSFKKGARIKFVDSLKIIPLKVEKIAEAFKLSINKLKIDYEDYTINQKSIQYIAHDCIIIARALKFFIDNGFTKMTIGSNAYKAFLDMCPMANDIFPPLDIDFMINYRKAYRGGRTQVNPKYANKVLHNVKRYDINSMYPYCQAFMDMPYGEPIPIKDMGDYKFEVYHVQIDFTLKKGHLPTLLKTSGMFTNEDSYYIDSDGVADLYITSVDLDILYRHYDVHYLVMLDGYGFKTSTTIFREFIMKYYNLKSQSTGGMKLLYKLIINNLYGKFGSKPRGCKKIPHLEDGVLCFSKGEVEEMKKYYLPVALAIVSYAHLLIDNAIIECGEEFVYCDTDSVHTLGSLPGCMVDNKAIGKFKLEGVEDTSKYVRQKCYIYCELDKNKNKVYTITCSGMSEHLKEFMIDKYGDDVFKEFKIGLKLDSTTEGLQANDMKLLPIQVPGGVVLKPTQFNLRGVII